MEFFKVVTVKKLDKLEYVAVDYILCDVPVGKVVSSWHCLTDKCL